MYDPGDTLRPTMSLGDESSRPEVALVGAGLAGLSAALTLRRLAKHVRVSILEKESRIGGRVLTSRRVIRLQPRVPPSTGDARAQAGARGR